MRIKTLTIWEPWATLIVAGIKRFETRGYKVNHRGPLGIHAASRWHDDQQTICCRQPYRDMLAGLGWNPEDTLGRVLGVAHLDCVIPTQSSEIMELSALEKQVGDYRPGRFAWRLAQAQAFKQPVFATGARGLWFWDVPPGLEKVVQSVHVDVKNEPA